MKIKMVDISGKKPVYREAQAYGKILLKKDTIDKIRRGVVEKGDVLTTAQIAAILAAKNVPNLIPLCHPIPVTSVEVKFKVNEKYIEVFTKVKTTARTGVEMEALVATSIALLTIWDMVKKYEKDEEGQYPYTKIEEIRIIKKVKDVNVK